MDEAIKRKNKTWELDGIRISHNVIDSPVLTKSKASNDSDNVRLHFGLRGSYSFHYDQLGKFYDLSGYHNNIMYSNGFDIEVENKSTHIETFGINFDTQTFLAIAEKGNAPLQQLAERIVRGENAIMSNEWKVSTLRMQEVIEEIVNCPYNDALKNMFLYAKSIELLVLQAQQYADDEEQRISHTEKTQLIEARDVLNDRIDKPPTISQLSVLVGLNEYKLKSGFKHLFGTTVFGYVNALRMGLARRLLLGTELSAKEIAYQSGYSSPQHFSRAFKKQFGVSPNSMRKNPD